MKFSKPSKSVNRAFAVISCIGATIKACPDKSDEMLVLQTQANRMMRVYNVQVGSDYYWKVSKSVELVWKSLAEEYQNKIPESAIHVLVATLSHLINEKTFRELLTCVQPIIMDNTIDKEDFNKIIESTLRLGDEFNLLFQTKSPTCPLPVVPKVKVKKARPKVKSKAQKAFEKEQQLIQEAKERKKKFLQERIAAARQRKD